MLDEVARFDEFGQVHLDGGAVGTGLLFGLRSGELFELDVREQGIDLGIGQLAALNAGG